MKRRILKVVLGALVALISGCATLDPQSAADQLVGTWVPEGTYAVYKITRASDGEINISGYSKYSGKELKILSSSWDGEVLRFTSYLASTNMKVIHENRLINSKRMSSTTVETQTGVPRNHRVVWNKRKNSF